MKISNILNILKKKDPELYKAILAKKLDNTSFAIRWILLMFGTDFHLEELIWLWDRILSDSYRFEMLEFCCASLLILLRNILITQDFDRCMEVLQNLSLVDVEVMFDVADALRRENSDIIKAVTENLK